MFRRPRLPPPEVVRRAGRRRGEGRQRKRAPRSRRPFPCATPRKPCSCNRTSRYSQGLLLPSRPWAAPEARPLKPQDNPGRRTKQVQFRDMVLNFLVYKFTINQPILASCRHGAELPSPRNRCTGLSFPNRRNASGPAPCGRRSPWARPWLRRALAPWRAGRRRGPAPSSERPSHRGPCYFGRLTCRRPRRAPYRSIRPLEAGRSSI